MATKRVNETGVQTGFSFSKYSGSGSSMADVHYHPNHELYYMLEGKGKYFIGNSTYEIAPGDLIVIPSRVIHRTIYNGAYRRRLLINCSSAYIPEEVFRAVADAPRIIRSAELSPEIERYFRLIEKEYHSDDPYASAMVRSYVNQLYVLIARSESSTKVEEVTTDIVAFALSQIKENYADRITLEDMARRCSVSVSHLSKIFKAETGLGFSDYLSTLRLERAEVLLRDNKDLSVTEVAFACGFNDSNYFSDKFKKHFGMSPLKFKKKAKE